ncbi:hypothetical protein TUM17384_13750 [Shewanella algae]|nr:hypothetical protein TUM17384_13750 [Shewanella algae]
MYLQRVTGSPVRKGLVLGRPVLHGVPIRAAGDGELAAKRKFIGEFWLKAMISALSAA